jgi:hypothetical protein
MSINYATKYSPKVAERFKKASITNSGAGHEYSFLGAKTIVVSSIGTVPLTRFKRDAASNRFGDVQNLGDTTQEMQMGEDWGFSFAIDAGDNSDQAIEKSAGKALRREIDEVVIPTLDQYRLKKWAEGAGTVKMSGNTSALTKTSILGAIIATGGEMSNALVPEANRTLYIPIRNYMLLVQADAVVNLEKTGTEAVEQGVVGTIDRNKVVPVPDGWFPDGVEFLIKHKGCTADPVKLQNYHIRKDAQGFDGPVVEGRIYYDSFVLDAKKAGVAVYKIGAAT